MIKPRDIPDDFAEIAEELFKEGYWSHAEKHFAAEFLNAAIEAGLVSPPCWVMRFNGELQRDTNGEPTVWPSRGLDSPDGSISYEHWKGQTE